MTVDLGKFTEDAKKIYIEQINTFNKELGDSLTMYQTRNGQMTAMVIWHGSRDEVQKGIQNFKRGM